MTSISLLYHLTPFTPLHQYYQDFYLKMPLVQRINLNNNVARWIEHHYANEMLQNEQGADHRDYVWYVNLMRESSGPLNLYANAAQHTGSEFQPFGKLYYLFTITRLFNKKGYEEPHEIKKQLSDKALVKKDTVVKRKKLFKRDILLPAKAIIKPFGIYKWK